MEPNVQRSVAELRESLRSRKAAAGESFQAFKLSEIVRELPVIELAQAEGWQSPLKTPVIPKPRTR